MHHIPNRVALSSIIGQSLKCASQHYLRGRAPSIEINRVASHESRTLITLFTCLYLHFQSIDIPRQVRISPTVRQVPLARRVYYTAICTLSVNMKGVNVAYSLIYLQYCFAQSMAFGHCSAACSAIATGGFRAHVLVCRAHTVINNSRLHQRQVIRADTGEIVDILCIPASKNNFCCDSVFDTCYLSI
jgi:hypothetical protein